MKKLLDHYMALEEPENATLDRCCSSAASSSSARPSLAPCRHGCVLPSVVAITAGWIILNSNQKEA